MYGLYRAIFLPITGSFLETASFLPWGKKGAYTPGKETRKVSFFHQQLSHAAFLRQQNSVEELAVETVCPNKCL